MAHNHAYLICESKCLVEGVSKEHLEDGTFIPKNATMATMAQKDSDGNTINTTYSKKSEAKQVILNSDLPSSKFIYFKSQSTQPRVQLPLLSGKTSADTIGISGRLSVVTSDGSLNFDFNVLWDSSVSNTGSCVSCSDSSLLLNKFQLLHVTIGIDINGKLYLSNTPELFDLINSTLKIINSVSIYSLNVFYK